MPVLTAKRVRELLNYDPDTGFFTWRELNWRRRSGALGNPDQDGYLLLSIGDKTCRAHRIAWLYVYGELPKGGLDHINGVRDDNRIANLRLATVGQNRINAKMDVRNTSGHTGVRRNRHGNWSVYCGKKYIKSLTDKNEAAAFAHQLRKEKYGEFVP